MTMKFQNPGSSVSGRMTYAYMICADESVKSAKFVCLHAAGPRSFIQGCSFCALAQLACASLARRYSENARRYFGLRKNMDSPATPPAMDAADSGVNGSLADRSTTASAPFSAPFSTVSAPSSPPLGAVT